MRASGFADTTQLARQENNSLSRKVRRTSKMRRVSLIGAVSCALLALSATGASANDSTHVFVAGRMVDINDRQVTGADGVYGTMTVIFGMKAPTSGSAASATLAPGQTLQGNNARNYQVANAHSGSTEFMGIGYVAGTNTGTNSSGGVLKDAYNDGRSCPSSTTSNCQYQLFVNKNIQGGQVVTFQIQRVPKDANGHHVYRFWLDNIVVNERDTFMTSGYATLASEKEHAAANTQAVNMDGDFTDLNYHLYGSAESAPPGHTNYTRPYNLALFSVNSGCSANATFNSSNQMYSVTNSGSC